MSNTNRDVFGIKSIQSLLRETNQYKGRIDGLFGTGGRDSLLEVLKSKVGNKVPTLPELSTDAKKVFTFVQTILAFGGWYTATVDGIWGNGSQRAMRDAVTHYKESKGIPEYSYAWTAHKNVPAEGVKKIEAWMVKHNKPLEHVSYLLSSMALETGRRFDPSIQNPKTGATGLIQFMPKTTVPDLGTTTSALAKMTFVDQLDYVFKYFEKYGYIKKCKFLEDYYLSIFYPAHVGKDPDLVVAVRGTALYSQNSGFDKDKDGKYTIGEIASTINEFYWDGLAPANRLKIS